MRIKKRCLFFLLVVFTNTILAVERKSVKDSITLKTVVVNSLHNMSDEKYVPASITVVTRETIDKTDESSVLSSLRGLIPGLFITERGTTGYGIYTGAGGGISLRGIGGNPMTQVLISIDGHPEIMGINGHDLPDAYVSYNAERIEVTRGPASTVYGSNAMGGIINIVTREGNTDELRTNAMVMAGSYNTQKYMLNINSKKNKLTGFFSTNYDKADGQRNNSAFNLFSAFAKIGYSFSDHYKTSAGFNLSDYQSIDPGPINNPATTDSMKAIVKRGIVSLNFDNNFWNTSGSTKLYYDFGNNKLYDGWKSNDFDAGLLIDQSYVPWAGSAFTLGLDYKIYGGKVILSKMANVDKTIHETAAYFTALQNLFNDKITIDAGMRFEFNSVYGKEWVPRSGLSYRPFENSVLKISVAKGFRSPTIKELYIFAANANLKPEEMDNYEISFIQSSPNKRFKGEVTVYKSVGDNIIQTIVTAGVPKSFNTGNFKNNGIELATQYYFPFHLNILANYSYISWSNPILATPKHQINTEADYTFGKLNVMLNLQQVKDYYLFLKTTNNPAVIKDFTLLNTTFNYKLTKHLDLFCKADNILNYPYQLIYNYPMPGITAMGGFKLSLNH